MIIKDDERVDDLQRNGYRIIQKKKGFCFGMDAVLLSGFARADAGEKVLDLECPPQSPGGKSEHRLRRSEGGEPVIRRGLL